MTTQYKNTLPVLIILITHYWREYNTMMLLLQVQIHSQYIHHELHVISWIATRKRRDWNPCTRLSCEIAQVSLWHCSAMHGYMSITGQFSVSKCPASHLVPVYAMVERPSWQTGIENCWLGEHARTSANEQKFLKWLVAVMAICVTSGMDPWWHRYQPSNVSKRDIRDDKAGHPL